MWSDDEFDAKLLFFQAPDLGEDAGVCCIPDADSDDILSFRLRSGRIQRGRRDADERRGAIPRFS